jgi:hypothetical protein
VLVGPASAPPPAKKSGGHAWIWIVGGAILVAGAVTALVVLSPANPNASFGTATGN